MAKGKAAVAQSDADAKRDLARQRRRRPEDLPPAQPRGEAGVLPGKWTPDYKFGLPSEKGCEFPVQCLGRSGGLYHLIDSAGEFVSEAESFFTHAGLQSIFCAVPNYPQWCAPRYGRAPRAKEGEPPPPPPIESFKDDRLRELIFRACRRAGNFSPADKLRGRGAWRLKGGQLLYHAGEELWVAEAGQVKMLETGLLDGLLYPQMAELAPPWTEFIAPKDNPAGPLLETLRKWNWERPAIDPVLLLGWIGVAYLGGALDWRPAVFLLGDKSTGKSTLQDGLKHLFGDHIMQSADTTAPAIAQTMKHDTRAVALDELEAEADPRKIDAVVALARAASSGAFRRRGSSDQQAVETQMRSAFLFSAINNPLQRAQDLSRVAVLRLKQLGAAGADGTHQVLAKPITPELEEQLPLIGRMILGQLMREWPRFDATYEAFAEALAKGGHDARGQKTYGTLLAAAALMLGDELAEALGVELADLDWWTRHLSTEALPEIEDAKPNWRNAGEHLLQAQVEPWRNGARATVGKALEDLAVGERDWQKDAAYTREMARRDLALTGLGLLHAKELIAASAKKVAKELGRAVTEEAASDAIGVKGEDGFILAVPNQSQLVARLYAGTPWAGSPGAGGPWKDALRQCPYPGVMLTDRALNRVSINGVETRCTLIVLHRFHQAPEQ